MVSFILEDEAEFWWDMIARTDDYESIDAVMELEPSTSNMVVQGTLVIVNFGPRCYMIQVR